MSRLAQTARRLQESFGQSNEAPQSNATAYTLDWHIAQARREMGEARWAQLNREWEGAPFAYGLMAGMDEGTS